MREITVVGGGLTGLIAAVECAEAGAPVHLLEARGRLGGRAATTAGPYLANLGPHAFYKGPLWDWLRAGDLHRPYRVANKPWIRFRWDDEIRRLPPRQALRILRLARTEAPVDRSLHDWMTERADERTARVASGLGGVVTFDHDPGRLSAQFVWSRMQRLLIHQPVAARYVVGGWDAVVQRLAAHAQAVGVRIETGAKVDHVRDLGEGPVIPAVGPRAARHLLDDDTPTSDETLRPESPRTALLDVGLRRQAGGPYLVLDLDEAAFVNRFTAVDETLAPAGHSLIQAMVGLRPGEELASGEARLEHILDLAHPGWRDSPSGAAGPSSTSRRALSTCPGAPGGIARPSPTPTTCGSPATGWRRRAPRRGRPRQRHHRCPRRRRGAHHRPTAGGVARRRHSGRGQRCAKVRCVGPSGSDTQPYSKYLRVEECRPSPPNKHWRCRRPSWVPRS